MLSSSQLYRQEAFYETDFFFQEYGGTSALVRTQKPWPETWNMKNEAYVHAKTSVELLKSRIVLRINPNILDPKTNLQFLLSNNITTGNF